MSIRRLTSFNQSGEVPEVITIESEADLTNLPEAYIPIGGGSNILINPSVKLPIVKVSSKYCETAVLNDEITCSAGLPLASFLKTALNHNLSGLEFATGVPASMGGMVYMNFECWQIEVAQFVKSILVYDHKNKLRWVDRSEYKTAYRWSSFHDQSVIILAVKFKLIQSDPVKIKEKMNQYLDERKQKQPILFHTFGSVFKNPLPKKAGQLIDTLQLKGKSIGGAKISEIHANFFENINNASFKDTYELIKLIQNKVSSMYNIKLECEVQIID